MIDKFPIDIILQIYNYTDYKFIIYLYHINKTTNLLFYNNIEILIKRVFQINDYTKCKLKLDKLISDSRIKNTLNHSFFIDINNNIEFKFYKILKLCGKKNKIICNHDIFFDKLYDIIQLIEKYNTPYTYFFEPFTFQCNSLCQIEYISKNVIYIYDMNYLESLLYKVIYYYDNTLLNYNSIIQGDGVNNGMHNFYISKILVDGLLLNYFIHEKNIKSLFKKLYLKDKINLIKIIITNTNLNIYSNDLYNYFLNYILTNLNSIVFTNIFNYSTIQDIINKLFYNISIFFDENKKMIDDFIVINNKNILYYAIKTDKANLLDPILLYNNYDFTIKNILEFLDFYNNNNDKTILLYKEKLLNILQYFILLITNKENIHYNIFSKNILTSLLKLNILNNYNKSIIIKLYITLYNIDINNFIKRLIYKGLILPIQMNLFKSLINDIKFINKETNLYYFEFKI